MGKPHGKDLRKGRYSQAGQWYAVTTVVYERKPLFHDLYLGRIVVNAMRYQDSQGYATTIAYVVMPDHLHWLFQLSGNHSLDKLVKSVKQFSATQINRRLGRTGQPVWQEGYYDHALRTEEDIKPAARYIVANPLRAGLVEKIGDYSLWDAIYL